MKPIHILTTIAKQEDVFLPLLLAEMSRDSGTAFRVSVFLQSPQLATQVGEMAKIFVRCENPWLRKLRDARIECFSENAKPTEEIDIILAATSQDLTQMATPAKIAILHRPPSVESAHTNSTLCNHILMPFAELAAIEMANCAEKMGIEHEDLDKLACFSKQDDLHIYAKSDLNGAARFSCMEIIASKALNSVEMGVLPARLPSIILASQLLRSWRQDISSTILRRGVDGKLIVEPVVLQKGEITLESLPNS